MRASADRELRATIVASALPEGKEIRGARCSADRMAFINLPRIESSILLAAPSQPLMLCASEAAAILDIPIEREYSAFTSRGRSG